MIDDNKPPEDISEELPSGMADQYRAMLNAFQPEIEPLDTSIADDPAPAVDDSSFQEFLNQNYSDDPRATSIMNEFSAWQKQQSVTEAAVATPTGQVVPVAQEGDALIDELERLSNSPGTPDNQERARQIRAQLEARDPMVDVDDPNIKIDTSGAHRVY